MSKNLVLTIAVGAAYEDLAMLTHPSIQAYSDKIGADFMSIDKIDSAKTTAHWEKFRIYDLFKKYDRIAFIDTDIIIRADAPSIFDLVPESELGMFNESPYTNRSEELMIDTCKQYDVKLPNWDGCYYNSGVMVISRRHRQLFKKPEVEHFSFYEQTYLNMMIAKMNIKMFKLPYQYNRMTCMDRVLGEDRHASYFIHYAGAPNIESVKQVVVKDLKTWDEWENGRRTFKQHIYVSVSGGIGDELCAEPTLRYMKDHVYPDAEILVGVHHPRLFKHLGLAMHKHGEPPAMNGNAWATLNTFPDPNSHIYGMLSNLLCHTVDYCSIAALKRTLPLNLKQFQLDIEDQDIEEVKDLVGDMDLRETVIIHPGKHWESKTFPVEWWQRTIDGIAKEHPVCLIGQNEIQHSREQHGDRVYFDGDGRGVLDVECPDTGKDLTNLLSLGGLMYLLSQSKVLLSNDSAPVHIAGAFDNWIVLIPTCKHPDHILPYRNGTIQYKTKALYKELVLDEFSSKPTEINQVLADRIPRPWETYLPDTDTVINEISNLFMEV